jgi:voltage-gated potassium channel
MPAPLRAATYSSQQKRVGRLGIGSLVKAVLIASILTSVLGAMLFTLPDLSPAQKQWLRYALIANLAIFSVEYGFRLWTAPEAVPGGEAQPWRARLDYARSFLGVLDLLVILPIFFWLAIPHESGIYNFVGLLALFKSAHYAQSMQLFITVFRNERKPLASYLVVLLVLLVVFATAAYVVEHDAQPNTFRSIPHALWWAIVTMSTVGYGDIMPITPLGKLVGGLTMILGIALFAVPAGIVTNGFAAELKRREFVVTWRTVASMPLFKTLDAIRIADIAQLLKAQVVPARQVVVRRGEAADAMFFIMAGEVEVDVPPEPIRLGEGQYFGEIALLRDTVRTATVITVDECTLLSLDARDFRRLMERHPDLKAAIEAVAEGRLHTQGAGPAAG